MVDDFRFPELKKAHDAGIYNYMKRKEKEYDFWSGGYVEAQESP